jgi:hypothetical protein
MAGAIFGGLGDLLHICQWQPQGAEHQPEFGRRLQLQPQQL